MKVEQNPGVKNNTILVTSASGFLGKKLCQILQRNYNVYGIRRQKDNGELPAVDLTDANAVMAYITLARPAIVIHTAGIAEPGRCEKDPVLAEKVNVTAVKNLIAACRKWKIRFILISTDYVFDGEKGSNYKKKDPRMPKNLYGRTKVQAEDIVGSYSDSLIIRVPILYGYNDENDKETFPVGVMKNLAKNQPVYVDNRQIRYPVLIDEAAVQIADSLYKNGIMHISSGQGVTKYEWAKVIADRFGYDKKFIQIRNDGSENRPPHVRLEISDGDALTSDVETGTRMMQKQMCCAFRLIYKSHADHDIYGKNVGQYRYRLGKSLGTCIPTAIIREIDYVVPVPSSGLYYAMGLAEEIRVPYLQALVKSDSETRSFQISDPGLREKMIRDKIHAIPQLLSGKSLALVDEAVFTGVTLKIVCDMVRACGAKKIYICIPTPFEKKECRQYVQPERRLLSEEVGDQTLEAYFQADGIFFQSHRVFLESIADIQGICFECFGQAEKRSHTDDCDRKSDAG